jgi:FlaG/FlaF family flagellin (archaellin)
MAFANSSISDIIATNIQSRTGELADNVTNNNALLRRLKDRGNVKTFSGGNVILQEIMYNDSTTNNTNSYSGYEVLNVSQNSPISSAQFSITQYAAAVSISGLEMIQNSGKEAIIDLLDGRMNVAEAQLANRIGSDIYKDGTGNSGKDLTGLAAAVPDAPSTGTYGGINRANYSFWRSQKYSGVTDGGSAVSASNIQSYMDSLAVQLIRGTDKPDLIVADSNYYRLYLQSMQSIQRVTDGGNSTQGAGFASLKYYGAGMASDVVLDGGIGAAATANHMWFLNTKYLMFRPHVDRNFVPIGGERQAVNQDAVVKLIGWAGNLTSSGPQFCGVLIA